MVGVEVRGGECGWGGGGVRGRGDGVRERGGGGGVCMGGGGVGGVLVLLCGRVGGGRGLQGSV